MRSICTPSVRFSLPAGGTRLIWFPSRSGGDLSERGTITEFSNSLTPLTIYLIVLFNFGSGC
jgi:hypothetical protein